MFEAEDLRTLQELSHRIDEYERQLIKARQQVTQPGDGHPCYIGNF